MDKVWLVTLDFGDDGHFEIVGLYANHALARTAMINHGSALGSSYKLGLEGEITLLNEGSPDLKSITVLRNSLDGKANNGGWYNLKEMRIET
jgi:hypothetical protein